MNSIKKISNYHILFSKAFWNEDDQFLAKCLDLKEDEKGFVADVRVVSKKAVHYFIKTAFEYTYNSPSMKAYRDALFLNLKEMYDHVYKEFMATYYPKAGYANKLGKDLRQHQLDVLCQSIYRRDNLLALDMGTGKTLTAATLSKITGSARTIIICPSLVKWNWIKDMTEEWGFNAIYWTIIDAKPSKTIRAFQERFVVINYEQVAKNMDYLLRDRIDHIIIDESHYLKNHNSNRSTAVQELIHKAEHPRLTMLTGTPVTNRINDMFNYLKMSEHPMGKNFTAFKKRYAKTSGKNGKGKVVGAKNIPELKGRLSNMMIRLRSEDCLDLPPMIIKKYYFDVGELSNEYQHELEDLRANNEKYEKLEGQEKAQMKTSMRGNIHTLNRLVATSKVKMIKELIDNIVNTGEKVIVFCGYKDPLLLLEDKLGSSCVRIDGSVDAHKRQMLIDRFIKDDSCNVFLGNMQAAGIGINLVNARHVIFMNFPFTPDLIEQAQKRAHRSGQKKKVYVYYTIGRETIDEHVYSLVAEKANDINQLVDGDHEGVIRYGNITNELFKRLLER